MSSFKIQNSTAVSDGGFLWYSGSNTSLTFLIENTTISNISSSLLVVEIESSQTDNGGGFAYIDAQNLTLKLLNCTFENITSQ